MYIHVYIYIKDNQEKSFRLHKTATVSKYLQVLIYKLNESAVGTKWSTNNKLGSKKVWKDIIYQKLKLITAT